MSKSPIARCIDCDEQIQFDEQPRLGMLVICENCDAELEVVRKSPLELDWPLGDDDEEDVDDFDFDDDDEGWDDEDWEDDDEDDEVEEWED